MNAPKKIKSALISVYDKTGLDNIVKSLHANNVTIYSTGGTQAFIEGLNIPVERVEDLTDFPEILGGRVKTLHPKIFGGILNRQDHAGDVEQMKEFNIPQIDLVIVDLRRDVSNLKIVMHLVEKHIEKGKVIGLCSNQEHKTLEAIKCNYEVIGEHGHLLLVHIKK